MKTIATLLAGVTLAASATAMAQPYPISQATAGATNYEFFVIRDKKLRNMSVAQATEVLRQALAPYGVTPCIVQGDFNTSIACGKPTDPDFMMPLAGEFFTYDLAYNFKDVEPVANKKLNVNKDGQYNQVYAVNFRSPQDGVAGDAAGRNPVRIQFAWPVTEFSFLADGGQAIAPASTQIRFTVNGVALAPQDLTPGTPKVVGVADPAGFTEVTIEALGGFTQAFIASDFAFVPMP